MKNHLILVEGLPCSGKSTTASYIAQLLTDMGINVIFVDEGSGAHPADYEFQGFISESKFSDFSLDEKEQIIRASTKRKCGYIVELNQISAALFDKVLPYKIYDFLDWNIEKELLLDKWTQFVAEAKEDTTYVFNCCFLQNPMCETMMRFGLDIDCSRDYIKDIGNIINGLNPLCIYLNVDNVSARIQDSLEERGDDWLQSVIEYHTQGAYGKQNKLRGFEGYISCLEERKKREIQILQDLDMDKIIINQSKDNWINIYKQIEKYFKEQKLENTYQIYANKVTAKEFEMLEKAVGWGTPDLQQIEVALKNSLYSVGVYVGDSIIAMARLIGDIGMSYLIKDVVVLPDYQGNGIGKMLIDKLMNYIKETSIPGTIVCVEVMSALGKEGFYKSCGFRLRPNEVDGHGLTKMVSV